MCWLYNLKDDSLSLKLCFINCASGFTTKGSVNTFLASGFKTQTLQIHTLGMNLWGFSNSAFTYSHCKASWWVMRYHISNISILVIGLYQWGLNQCKVIKLRLSLSALSLVEYLVSNTTPYLYVVHLISFNGFPFHYNRIAVSFFICSPNGVLLGYD